MNQQEVFVKVANHLMAQKKTSTRSGWCAYRGYDGLMCAVGCLIKDEHYSIELESRGVGCGSVRKALEASGIPDTPVYYKLLSALQDIHDSVAPARWGLVLTLVMHDFKLSPEGLGEWLHE